MDASNPSSPSAGPARPAWNKGKLTGPKPPLRLGHVWSIRARLQLERRTRDLALFNLAIDSKLRGCDLIAVRVDDVAPNGYAIDRASVRQRKTGRPVRFELTEVTRQAVDDFLRASDLTPGHAHHVAALMMGPALWPTVARHPYRPASCHTFPASLCPATFRR
jgi:integrase